MRAWFIVATVLLAGCATTEGPAPVQEAPAAVEPASHAWNITLTDCDAVAGVSVYPRGPYAASSAAPPPPFVPADIRDEIGDARIASANGAGWATVGDEVAGHWHMAVSCAEATWGFVGIRIEPPFNTSVEHNVLLAVFSWPVDLKDDVAAHGHATLTERAEVSIDARVTMLLDDADHGRYEGTAPRGDALAPHDNETIRLWFLLPASGEPNHHEQEGPYMPVAYDLDVTSYGREALPEAVGFFAHTETDHHAPLPGLAGNDAAVTWTGFDAVLHEGPRPNITLDATWVH